MDNNNHREHLVEATPVRRPRIEAPGITTTNVSDTPVSRHKKIIDFSKCTNNNNEDKKTDKSESNGGKDELVKALMNLPIPGAVSHDSEPKNDKKNTPLNNNWILASLVLLAIFIISIGSSLITVNENTKNNKNNIDSINQKISNIQMLSGPTEDNGVDGSIVKIENNTLYISTNNSTVTYEFPKYNLRGSSQTNPETYFGQIKGYVTDLFANHTSETIPESYKEQIKTYVTYIINNDNTDTDMINNDNTDQEYFEYPICPGVNQAGSMYNPRTDQFQGNLFKITFDKRRLHVLPSKGSCRIPDFVDIQNDFKYDAFSYSRTMVNKGQYIQENSHNSDASIGYESIFGAAKSGITSIGYNAFNNEDTVVIKHSVSTKYFTIDLASDADKYLDDKILTDISNLPIDWENNKDKYEDFFKEHNAYFIVNNEDVGGLVMAQTIFSRWEYFKSKYGQNDIEQSISASFLFWSGGGSTSSSEYKASQDSSFFSNAKTNVYVMGGDAVGDITDPDSCIRNIKNWGNSHWQTHYQNSENNPTTIGISVNPLWIYLAGENQRKIKEYMLDLFSSPNAEQNRIDAIEKEVEVENSSIRKSMKETKDKLEEEILNLKKKSVCKFIKVFDEDRCKWVTASSTSACGTGWFPNDVSIEKDTYSLSTYRHLKKEFMTASTNVKVYCCPDIEYRPYTFAEDDEKPDNQKLCV